MADTLKLNGYDFAGFNFIGIGKVIIDLQNGAEYNIPHLHFLLSLGKDGAIEAVNIEFAIVASGKDTMEAARRLAEMLTEYVKTTLNDPRFGFNTLTQVAGGRGLDDLWHEYRVMEFRLAEQGRDVGHTFIDAITNKIRKEFEQKYGVRAKAQYSTLHKAA